MNKYELEKIDQLDIDFRDDAIIKEFAEAVEEQIKPYRVKAYEVGLEEAEKSRKFITKIKNKVDKYFKGKRDHINAARQRIIDAGKMANDPLIKLEADLKKDIATEQERQLMEERKATLPLKLETLKTHGLEVPEEQILAMDDTEFLKFVHEKLEERSLELKRKQEEEKRIKEAEEKARAEAEAKAAEQIKQAKEEGKQEAKKEIQGLHVTAIVDDRKSSAFISDKNPVKEDLAKIRQLRKSYDFFIKEYLENWESDFIEALTCSEVDLDDCISGALSDLQATISNDKKIKLENQKNCPDRKLEGLIDDLAMLEGLPPYDSPGNINRHDNYFGKSIHDAAQAYINKNMLKMEVQELEVTLIDLFKKANYDKGKAATLFLSRFSSVSSHGLF